MIRRRRSLISRRKRKKQLCYPLLLLHQQTNLKLDLRSLQLGLHSPHWGLIQIVSECFYLVLILSQCSFYTVPHCGDKMKTKLILKWAYNQRPRSRSRLSITIESQNLELDLDLGLKELSTSLDLLILVFLPYIISCFFVMSANKMCMLTHRFFTDLHWQELDLSLRIVSLCFFFFINSWGLWCLWKTEHGENGRRAIRGNGGRGADASLHLQTVRRQALSHQVWQKQTVYVSPHEHWAVPGEPGCQHSWLHRGWLPPVGYNRGNKAEEYRQSSQPLPSLPTQSTLRKHARRDLCTQQYVRAASVPCLLVKS